MANAQLSARPDDPEKWTGTNISEQILGDAPGDIPAQWATSCAFRLRRMRDELRRAFIGMKVEGLGWITDWIVASLIARENVLLLGPPGVAKSEMATYTLKLLGLSAPEPDDQTINSLPERVTWEWWQQRCKQEGENRKYFHYLLSRFTQAEELFGPLEISLLRQGMLVRVNFGLLTGPGVWGAFLDEVFKGSSSILNTLLTLTQERCYFNWGGMQRSNLLMFIGASNEMPGGFASGMAGVGGGGEDFHTLYAFLDRFPIRLSVPNASGYSLTSTSDDTESPQDAPIMPDPQHSDLAGAFDMAMSREGRAFTTRHHFDPQHEDMPTVNDILLLGRFCFQHQHRGNGQERTNPYHVKQEEQFRRAFLDHACKLQSDSTDVTRKVAWTISPRKLKALYKIALAHALLTDDAFTTNAQKISNLGPAQLQVFNAIWDTSSAQAQLFSYTQDTVRDHYRSHR